MYSADKDVAENGVEKKMTEQPRDQKENCQDSTGKRQRGNNNKVCTMYIVHTVIIAMKPNEVMYMQNSLPCMLYSADKDVAKKGEEKKTAKRPRARKENCQDSTVKRRKGNNINKYTCMYCVHLAHSKFTLSHW